MIMKKSYLLAMALAAMVSCTSDEFVGENNSPNPVNNNGENAIAFASNTPRITRAGGADAATVLGNKFKVYAVKKTGTTYSNVFATNEYGTATDYSALPYWVWYAASTAGSTTSNTKNWEYVGTGGNVISPAISPEQTIKYWDYSADQYEFVAYSATYSATENTPSITKYQKDGFTVSGSAAELAGLYVADKVTISKTNNSDRTAINTYGGIVQLTFRSAGTKVRLGIYETIPGYVVKNVKFRPNASEFTESTENALLSGSFNGTSSSANGIYNVSYNPTTGIAEFDNTAASADSYFDFGTFASGTKIGETSIDPTWAGAVVEPSNAPYYQSVFPNTDNVGNMILYVNYDLYNSVTGETINVKGAKAVVPAMYMTWNPNYAYTYLFKISDNTNGTTGIEGESPEGIFPITFDALTIAATDGSQVGIITTVSTPAITTYQKGSVSDAGITYAVSDDPIYITVNTDGTLADLTSTNTKLYTVDTGTTEADLLLNVNSINKTEITSGVNALVFLSSDDPQQGITFASGKTAKFAPAAGKTYAVEYLVSPALAEDTYTVVVVTENVTTVTGLYERTGTEGNYSYNLTGDTTAQSGKTYCSLTKAHSAVYQYKIIVVAGSGS